MLVGLLIRCYFVFLFALLAVSLSSGCFLFLVFTRKFVSGFGCVAMSLAGQL